MRISVNAARRAARRWPRVSFGSVVRAGTFTETAPRRAPGRAAPPRPAAGEGSRLPAAARMAGGRRILIIGFAPRLENGSTYMPQSAPGAAALVGRQLHPFVVGR